MSTTHRAATPATTSRPNGPTVDAAVLTSDVQAPVPVDQPNRDVIEATHPDAWTAAQRADVLDRIRRMPLPHLKEADRRLGELLTKESERRRVLEAKAARFYVGSVAVVTAAVGVATYMANAGIKSDVSTGFGVLPPLLFCTSVAMAVGVSVATILAHLGFRVRKVPELNPSNIVPADPTFWQGSDEVIEHEYFVFQVFNAVTALAAARSINPAQAAAVQRAEAASAATTGIVAAMLLVAAVTFALHVA